MKIFFVNVQMLPIRGDAKELGIDGYELSLKASYLIRTVWKYLLIPHDGLAQNSSFDRLLISYGRL